MLMSGTLRYCGWFRNLAPVDRWQTSHLQGFNHPFGGAGFLPPYGSVTDLSRPRNVETNILKEMTLKGIEGIKKATEPESARRNWISVVCGEFRLTTRILW